MTTSWGDRMLREGWPPEQIARDYGKAIIPYVIWAAEGKVTNQDDWVNKYVRAAFTYALMTPDPSDDSEICL